MLGSPSDIRLIDMVHTLKSIDGVSDLSHVHFWQMQEHENALGAHLVIKEAKLSQVDTIREAVISKISADYKIGHFTLVT